MFYLEEYFFVWIEIGILNDLVLWIIKSFILLVLIKKKLLGLVWDVSRIYYEGEERDFGLWKSLIKGLFI